MKRILVSLVVFTIASTAAGSLILTASDYELVEGESCQGYITSTMSTTCPFQCYLYSDGATITSPSAMPSCWFDPVIGDPCYFELGCSSCPGSPGLLFTFTIETSIGDAGESYTITLLDDDWSTVIDTMTITVISLPPGDFDEDGEVDCDDLRVLALAWMSKSGDDNWNPDCDISDPNDEVIDGQDFGVFAMYWDGCGDPPPEPGMSFNIEDCDPGAKSTAGDKDALRFSVTVDGNYILFEDMIHTNCCPDAMWLEMEVENNQITIYEYAPGGSCFCMCDRPVTATLGPFEPGTYTLEVYKEDWGGFIGSTIVTIE